MRSIGSLFSQPTEWPNLTELWVFTVWCFTYLESILPFQDILTWYAPMHQITTLRLSEIPSDQCLYLLFHCPHLIEFHCSSPTIKKLTFPLEAISSSSQIPKLLPNLRISLWRSYNEDLNRFLFSSIRFPNLDKFSLQVHHDCLHGPESAHPVHSALVNEFMPSLSHITTLDWIIHSLSYPSFSEAFSRTDLSSLQRLYIRVNGTSDVIPWLEALTMDQQRGNCLFPRLKTIHIREPSQDSGAPLFEALYNCLRSRRFLSLRRMMKVAPYKRRDTITFVHWKIWFGRVLSILSNMKRTPSKVLSMVVFVWVLSTIIGIGFSGKSILQMNIRPVASNCVVKVRSRAFTIVSYLGYICQLLESIFWYQYIYTLGPTVHLWS